MSPAHPNRSKRKDAPFRNPDPEEIRALREAHGLTQPEAARLALATLRSYQDWEYGQRRMHPAIWHWWQSALFERANPHIGARRYKPKP